MFFFLTTILVGIFSIFLEVDCMPMPDMAAFLVFPTGSETGPWQVNAVLTIAGARRRELFRLVFR